MCLYYSPLLQSFNKAKVKMCEIVSKNDLQIFPTKFKYFPARVSPHIQPNSIQVYFDSMIMFEWYLKAYL
jgi:hypothetical protein